MLESYSLKVVQINTSANTGSTGRIAEGIGRQVIAHGHESYLAFGRSANASKSNLIRIGNRWDVYWHGMETRLLDRHGRSSRNATRRFLESLNRIEPDVLHLHNIHGYYLNYELLFEWIKKNSVAVVWTLHDCWAFTGHCAYFDRVGCEKWKSHCHRCPLSRAYPSSIWDDSKNNFDLKKECFSGVQNLHLVTPSRWLHDLCQQSFLKSYPLSVIPYGVDLEVFKPCEDHDREQVVLGVSKPWSERKGLDDFIKLRSILPNSFRIVLIGLSKAQLRRLPPGIDGFTITESVQELASWYSRATVFVNPTSADNFPLVNLEALACGTPVVTYRTGGSPEAICEQTGISIEPGNISNLLAGIQAVAKRDRTEMLKLCRARAEEFYSDKQRYSDFVNLYTRHAG